MRGETARKSTMDMGCRSSVTFVSDLHKLQHGRGREVVGLVASSADHPGDLPSGTHEAQTLGGLARGAARSLERVELDLPGFDGSCDRGYLRYGRRMGGLRG